MRLQFVQSAAVLCGLFGAILRFAAPGKTKKCPNAVNVAITFTLEQPLIERTEPKNFTR